MAYLGYCILKFVVLFAFWFCLSGKSDPLHLGLGVISTLLVMFLTRPAGKKRSPGETAAHTASLLKLIPYTFWLCYKILTAALHVAWVVLHPKLPIRPALLYHKGILRNNRNKVILANSITLTPGTITVDIDQDTFIVHQLDDDSAGDVTSHGMEQKIRAVFGGESA